MTSLILVAALQLAAAPDQANQFEQAFRKSAETGRPLVLLLGAKWCPGCRVMKNNVLPKVIKAGGMSEVEFVYIDIDRNRKLSAKLSKAKTIPQLIRYHRTPKGWRYNLLNGAHKVPEVTAFIKTGSVRPLLSKQADSEQPIRTVHYRTDKNRTPRAGKQPVNQ